MYPDTVVGFADLPESYRHGDDSWRPAPQPAGDAAARGDGVPSLPVAGIDMKAYFQTLERQWITEALEAHAGVISKAATHLGLRRTTLIEKMRKLDIKA